MADKNYIYAVVPDIFTPQKMAFGGETEYVFDIIGEDHDTKLMGALCDIRHEGDQALATVVVTVYWKLPGMVDDSEYGNTEFYCGEHYAQVLAYVESLKQPTQALG